MNALEDGNYVGIPQKVEPTGETWKNSKGGTMHKWNLEIEINGLTHEGTFSTTKPEKAPFKVGEECPVKVWSKNGFMNFSFDYDADKKGGGSFKGNDESMFKCNAMNNAISLVVGGNIKIDQLEGAYDKIYNILKG